MNCDQVFDVLTRGPFPTGEPQDIEVEAHLDECHECRQLADALRPALELFQEAIAPEESRHLPGYWSGVATDRPRRAIAAPASRLAASRRPAPTASAAGNMTWRLAAALVLGITLGTLANWRNVFVESPPWIPPADGGALLSPSGDDFRHAALASRRRLVATLPAVCLTKTVEIEADRSEGAEGRFTSQSHSELQCCTHCHYAARPGAAESRASVRAAVARECQVCHVN